MAPERPRERDLFSVRGPRDEKTSTKKRSKPKQDEDEESSHKKLNIGLANVDSQHLTYENIAVGQVLLGCVQQVHNYELLISLPHKLKGVVSLARISKAYTTLLTKVRENESEVTDEVHSLEELYRPGQYLVTRVVSLEEVNGKTKVNLTLMPQEVNFGISSSYLEVGHIIVCTVVSVEDNGFVMDTGIPNVRAAFLKNSQINGSGIVGVGSMVRCIITKILGSYGHASSIRLVLNADSRAVSEAIIDVIDTTNMALLLPGNAIRTTICKISTHYLGVLMVHVDGVVNKMQLRTPFDELSKYNIGMKVVARVLYIMPFTKVVHLTLQSTVCAARPEGDPLHGFKIGDRVEAEIYQSGKSGVFVKIGKNCRGFSSGNHLMDNIKNMAPKHVKQIFVVGTKQICRLLKYNYMDQLFIVSFQTSLLEQQIVGFQGVEAGQVVMAIIKGYNTKGAEVAVGKFVSGEVPFLHISNTYMKHPERKYQLGQQVKARVLKVNPERRHLLLTCKKRLVESEEAIVTDFIESYEDTVTEGYVVKIMQHGLLIALYNDVKGFAPRSTTNAEPGDSLEKLYVVGQVVKCKVIKVFPVKKSMTLCLDIERTKPLVKRKGSRLTNYMQVETL